jgi:hypothetical protein
MSFAGAGFSTLVAWSASPASGAIVVAAGTPIHVDLGCLLGQAGLHRRMTRSFEGHHHMIGAPLPIELAPSIGQQVLLPISGGLAKLVGARNLHVEALVKDLSVVGHRRHRVTGVKHPPTRVDRS